MTVTGRTHHILIAVSQVLVARLQKLSLLHFFPFPSLTPITYLGSQGENKNMSARDARRL